jgi:hypothetical protein
LSETRLAVACGLLGPAALLAYFVTPLFLSWPFADGSASTLTAYALNHQALFFAGAWLQGTGTLLCVIFFLALLRQAGAVNRLSGLLLIVSAASLLAVVLVESAFMVAVPMAAAAGDSGTVATAFAMSNGVFVRVFPLAPSSATYFALGLVLLGSNVIARPLAIAAVAIGALFELGGIAAIFTGAAVAALAVVAAGQALWIVAAAINLARAGR